MTDQPSYTAFFRNLLDELDRARPHIEAALAHAEWTHTFDDVCQMVAVGRAKFWPLPNGFIITEVLDFPREKHYHMWLGGGDLGEILALHPQVQQAAREAGCSKLTVSGRRGWVRALLSYGWRETHTTCVKDVE